MESFVGGHHTGTAPAVGYTRTIGPARVDDDEIAADWRVLEGQAALGHIDLIAKGTIDGKIRGLRYRPSLDDYVTDRTGWVRSRKRSSGTRSRPETP